MGIQSALLGVRDALINNYAEYTTDNCSVGDEAVFAYIQSTEGAPTTCAITEYTGFTRRQRSEMRSITLDWQVTINVFFMIVDTDYVTPLNNARALVDSFVLLTAIDSTLGNTVYGVQAVSGSEPMSYRRGNYEYVFVTISLSILDNISG